MRSELVLTCPILACMCHYGNVSRTNVCLYVEGQFPINLSVTQVERDHSFLDQAAIDALFRWGHRGASSCNRVETAWLLVHANTSLALNAVVVHHCVSPRACVDVTKVSSIRYCVSLMPLFQRTWEPGLPQRTISVYQYVAGLCIQVTQLPLVTTNGLWVCPGSKGLQW